jgi:hypothetical protein
MNRRMPRAPGLPLGGGLNLLLAAGAAYFVWEHGQGRHGRPQVLCPLCWLDKIAPAPEAPGGPSPAAPPEQT